MPPVTELLTPATAEIIPGGLSDLFPTYIPQAEQAIYEAVRDACGTRAIFPPDGQGLVLPLEFNLPPAIGLFDGRDHTYPPVDGREIKPIPVVRGWPAYPGQVPAIGVAETSASEDQSEDAAQAGFAGDVYAVDDDDNVVATASYYAEPLAITVVVELIHVNRDERDRLHDQLRRVIYPLRSILPQEWPQIREIRVDSEKQDLPVEEQPLVMYVSLYTVTIRCEALFATEIVPAGVIDTVDTSVTLAQLDATDEVEPADNSLI